VPNSTTTAYVDQDRRARDDDTSSPSSRASSTLDGPAAVELSSLAHRLGHRWALRGITLRVEPGEVLAIVGPNGSGKTTLLRVVATSLIPTRGSGRVFGYDLVREADAVRGAVGMLGHATGLYDDLTAGENLAFAIRMYGELASAASIEAVLDAVGMREHAAERVRGLSSGMRRRIALARLLLRRPRLLLLDEPYNTFDPTGVAVVHALIRDTARAGGAALVVTHDLGRTGGAGYDRVIGLSAGRLSDDGLAPREAIP
jgi:heme exporter protein A